MIVATLIFASLVIFLAGFLNLKFPNFTKKLSLTLQKPFFPSHVPTLQSTSFAVSSSTNISTKVITNNGGLKQVFDTFDKNGDGFITRQELRDSLNNIGIFVPANEVEEMVDKLDSNRDGLIDLGEFQELFQLMKGKEKKGGGDGNEDIDDDEGDLKEAFDVFDGDKDGLITVKELRLVLTSLGLKEGKREEDCQEMIRMVDVDGDGMVNFDEFKNMMKAGFGASTLVPAF